MAGVLAYGPGALLSYRSAGALWDILRYSGAVEVSLAGAGRRSRPGLILHQPRALAPQDAAEVAGIPVTSVARTLLDLASTLNLRRLQRAIEEAEGGDLLDLRKVRDVCARNRSHPGRKPLAVLIALLRAPQHFTRSELERAFVELCKEYGIPPPAMNMIIEGHEVDASWEEHRLIVEIDTIAFHGTRAAFERDRVRDATLQLAGWRVVRITDTRIAHEPAAVAALIHALLGTT